LSDKSAIAKSSKEEEEEEEEDEEEDDGRRRSRRRRRRRRSRRSACILFVFSFCYGLASQKISPALMEILLRLRV
jgi:hypothetical protein